MKIRWLETFEAEIIDQYDEEMDNIAECHDETFKAGAIDEVDIIDHDGDADANPDYVDLQFGDGSILTTILKSTFIEIVSTDKECESMCPNCGVMLERVEWGCMKSDSPPYQIGECKACGCTFHEVYKYAITTFNLGEVDRIKCPYPMSEFHTYMDEVPKRDRISITKDCEICDEENCDAKHCLIRGPRGDKFPPKRIDVDTINTAADYAALTQRQQVSFLIEKHNLSEKEAWEYRTDDIYGLPVPLAEDFDDYDDSKYPDENR